MTVFREFERNAVRTLVGSSLPEGDLEEVLASAVLVSCQHTGSGYFLTVRHAAVPEERTVCHRPLLIGRTGGLDCGFVVFLEGGELTLECHSWGAELPEDFRDRQVEITAS